MIHLLRVTKLFGPGVVALRDVTLRIAKGEFVLITGPSGAGKTTLLRTIFAAERPEEGQILVAGRNVARLRRSAIPYLRRNIGVVFQDFKLLGDRTPEENVAIALEIRGQRRQTVHRRSQQALAAVGLGHLAPRVKVSALSGGEQQRVAIARAIVAQPAILLADEPTGNLDPERSCDILDLLDQVARRGTTVVLATHDPMVVQNASCTRIVQLERGRVARVRAGARAPVRPRYGVPEFVDAAPVAVPASAPEPAALAPAGCAAPARAATEQPSAAAMPPEPVEALP